MLNLLLTAVSLLQVFVVTGPLFLPRVTRNGYNMGFSMIGEVCFRRPQLATVLTTSYAGLPTKECKQLSCCLLRA